MKLSNLILFAATAFVASGCHTTTLRSGKPAAEAPLEANERWHSGFLSGTQEASGPYDLERICPNGWSEIRTETSFANGVVEVMTVGLYNPQTVDVKCAVSEPKKEVSHR